MTIEIKGAVTAKIGFASHQNAVPVLRELEIRNCSLEAYDDLELTISSDPVFLEEKSWPIDRLAADSMMHITECDLKLNGALLGDLSECLIGEVQLRLMKGETELARRDFPIELLARSEWGGAGAMPELLAAFCMPNDPAVDQVLKAASDILRRAGKPPEIDGYESGSRTRVWQLASAVWSALASFDISYALPPASFEAQGQKVRTPAAILDGRIATCLDTALLFAAAFEQAGLNPLLVLTKGHAFVGVWLQPQEFSAIITDDASAVRKRFDLDELLLFETTLVTNAPAPRFDQAVAAGRRQVAEEADANFVVAVDIRRARMQRIRPLSVDRAEMLQEGADSVVQLNEALLDAPTLPDFEIEQPEETSGPLDRVGIWQRKLLDLTTRNRLLHLPENAKLVRLICPDPATLEDRLAEGKRIKIAPMPDLEAGGRDARLYEQQTAESLRDQFARAALEKGEVLSALEKSKLEASLIDLYRKAKSDMEEGGANTLFLALGFLKWKKAAEDPKQYRAPLILLPVKLNRKSVLTGVTLSAHEDEARFNLTLLELLRQDFSLSIPALENSLPSDDSGVDVSKVWNIVRKAVRDIQGFEVVEELAIGTFSFAKYLMWKDLVDRSEDLKESAVVRHLIERGQEKFCSGGDFPRPEDLDQRVDPADLFIPLPADSSQISAVVASANGCDFVLDGPPGTGKSQTIANMIAQNLAVGRRVLFVAEKRAALEVVYRRLEEKGLGDFCLELHSNKTSKVEVLKQLERAWDVRDALSADEWAREAADVRKLRDNLNDFVRLLHARQTNGLTLHGAIGRVVRDADEATPQFEWPAEADHSEEQLITFRDVARRLGIGSAGIRGIPAGFHSIQRSSWSNAWQQSIVAVATDLPHCLEVLLGARDRLVEVAHLAVEADDRTRLEALLELTATMLKTHGSDLGFAFAPDYTTKVSAAQRAIDLIVKYREIEAGLSTTYAPEAARRIDAGQFDAAWAMASGKFWFLATLAQKKVARLLGQQGGTSTLPDPGADLPRLHQLKAITVDLDQIGSTVSGIPGWNDLDSELERIQELIEIADGLRSQMAALATTPDDLLVVRSAVSTLVVEANDLLAPHGSVALASAALDEALPRYHAIVAKLDDLIGRSTADDRLPFAEQKELADAISRHHARLNAWCNWRRVRDEANGLGFKPLVEALEEERAVGDAALDLFETGYARWFAAKVIDAEPRLSQFVSDVHSSDIEAYRLVEDRLSSLASRYIRAQLCGQIPDKNEVGKRDGYGILKHQLQLQRRHKPVRQLATEMGDALTKLAPCMLMSPLSIAQYLPADQALFDLVIFDEASQIAPWDAIGSIARGKQVVIAGDPRQMPPTSFFNRAAGTSEGDTDTEEDMESILDECLGAGIPQHSLGWHYRSRHESLIAFSNNRYYENRLVTFPAPVTKESAVHWQKVDGVYAKGQTRTNQIEAKAIVAEVVSRLTDPTFVQAKKTIAVVTLNAEQQKLVEDLLDQERARNRQLERFFSEDLSEPVVVKNLETVQGDERDLILLGIGYGPTEPGARSMSMNFGPLNRDGGWRRLNVAVTRARQEMIVFTSFDANMIDLNRTSAPAVRDLKHFIEFADRGPRALAEAIQGSVGRYESPFEEAVAAALIRKGWVVVPQIGVSRFRIDLGIVHPDRPGDYLVGVECDGATYHSAATARDRDKVRAAILSGLGWRLVRVWSTDWWIDKEGATERLHAQIARALEDSRVAEAETEQAPQIIPFYDVPAEGYQEPTEAPVPEVVLTTREDVLAGAATVDDTTSSSTSAKSLSTFSTSSAYRATDFMLSAPSINSAAFYETSYNSTLNTLISAVVEQEAPISEHLLVQRIARAHGFLRSGRIIRERVMKLVTRLFHVTTDAHGGSFVWPSDEARLAWTQYRLPSDANSIRQIEEISFEELQAAAAASTAFDLPIDVARMFSVRRLSGSARKRIEAALAVPAGVHD